MREKLSITDVGSVAITRYYSPDEFLAHADSMFRGKICNMWADHQVALRQDYNSNNRKTMYNLYLCSKQWAEKKEQVYARDSDTCQYCGAPGQHVHHLSYTHLFDEPLDHLMLLCIHCHAKEGTDKMPEGNGGIKKTYGKRHQCDDCGKLIPSQYPRCPGCKEKTDEEHYAEVALAIREATASI